MKARNLVQKYFPETVSRKIIGTWWSQKSQSLETTPFFKAYPAKTDPVFINGRARISSEREYIYFRIPKAANSTIAANMLYYEEGISGNHKAVTDFKVSKRQLGDLTETEINSLIPNYYKFTVVRDPYSRLVSAYSDKILGNKRFHRSKVERFLKKRPGDEIKLSEFIDFLEFGEGVHSDGHWARQTDLIGIPLEDLNFIGKCERLSEDLPHIMNRIYDRSEKTLNHAPHATGSDKKVDACSTADLSRIYKVYEKDFDLLEYPSRNQK